MITKIKPDSLTEAKQQVRRFHKQGFTALHIRSEPREEGENPAKDMTDRLWLTTPYFYKGESLLAFCEVDRGDIRLDKSEALHIEGIELCTKDVHGRPDQNVKHMHLEETGSEAVMLQDAQGFNVSMEEAEDAVAGCAAGTVCFPHVMEYDEYMTIQKAIQSHMGLGTVREDAYTLYLDKCENEIQSGLIPYVGEVKDVNSLVYRRLDAMEHAGNTPVYEQTQGMEF